MKKLTLILSTHLIVKLLAFGQQEATSKNGKTVLLFENTNWSYGNSVTHINSKQLTSLNWKHRN